MAGKSSTYVFHQVQRLFNVGAVGMVSDAQLLDWFVSSKDDSAAAAFEELMVRHGPMVFRMRPFLMSWSDPPFKSHKD